MSGEHDAAVLNAIFNPLFPVEENEDPEDLPKTDNDNSSPSLNALEKYGIIAADNENLDEAIYVFTKAIEAAPNRPSGYNNRAQVYRLKKMTDEALLDLTKAIELSGGRGRTASQAFCQRGLIFLKLENPEQARKDFEAAAELGSHFAKSQLVKFNPYAALCNQMLQTAFNNLYA